MGQTISTDRKPRRNGRETQGLREPLIAIAIVLYEAVRQQDPTW